MGDKAHIVGRNDITLTNLFNIKQAVEQGSDNCLLLKMNHIYCTTKNIDTVNPLKQIKRDVTTYHWYGETEDSYIGNLTIGLCTCHTKKKSLILESEYSHIDNISMGLCKDHIKTGTPCRRETATKYNQIPSTEENIGYYMVQNVVGLLSSKQ